MNNGRFSISIHILTLLARAGNDLLSSEYIAGSVNINPVLVRKELINLRKHGLIVSKEGKSGGSMLARPADRILLSSVYQAVRQNPLLGQQKNLPNPACPVGRRINEHLDRLYQDAEEALLRNLGSVTLADFSRRFE
ncbi:Rrf2 family transcriptional regulator [Larkinella soli]|uniref:Rrf2 family transcriptional regulator n=1 Tax=Larkinella soli TaxID=1770527 RepID=UPI000FFC3B2F|nr:Rrf2 family transcriptional regulator [Larkinella soli]